MRSFRDKYLENEPVPHLLLRTIRLLGEYRGKEALFMQQTPQVLETLRQVAIIQSTESSNRIEGIEAAPERIKELVEHKTTPQNRSEQEIAGYRDVLNTIHANHANIPLTTGVVLQLQRPRTERVAGIEPNAGPVLQTCRPGDPELGHCPDVGPVTTDRGGRGGVGVRLLLTPRGSEQRQQHRARGHQLDPCLHREFLGFSPRTRPPGTAQRWV